jgi:integrase/recombinase XerD
MQEQELPMSTDTVRPLLERMIEDMNARSLCADTQRGHIRSCKRFGAFSTASPSSEGFGTCT